MSFRGIFSALIFIVLVFAGVALFQKVFYLSSTTFMALLFVIGAAFIVWMFLFSEKHADLRQPLLDTLTGNVKNPKSHYVGLALIVIGGVLAIGNKTGAFNSFPFAGGICIAIGAGIYAYSKSA